jgi:hypothetical protein
LRAALPIWERTHGDVDRLLTRREGDSVRAALRALS